MDTAFVTLIYAQARTHCPVARRGQMACEQSLLLGSDLEASRALLALLSRGAEATCDAWCWVVDPGIITNVFAVTSVLSDYGVLLTATITMSSDLRNGASTIHQFVPIHRVHGYPLLRYMA